MSVHKLKKVLLFFIVLWSGVYSYPVIGQDTIIVDDLETRALVFSPEFGSFVPFTGSKRCDLFAFPLAANDYSEYVLTFEAASHSALFIDNRLVYENLQSRSCETKINIGYLKRFAITGKPVLYYYSKETLPDYFSLSYISEKVIPEMKIPYTARIVPDQQGYFFVIFGIVFIFSVLKNRYPKRLTEMVGLKTAGRLDEPNQEIFNGWFFLLTLFNALFLTLLFVLPQYQNFNGVVFFSWFSLALICLYLKFFCVAMAGKIFKFDSLARNHIFLNQKYIFLTLVLTVPFLFLFISPLFEFHFSYMIFFGVLLLISVLTLTTIIFSGFKTAHFQFIYLFSYLCVAEIIPIGFILKITSFEL